MQSFRCKYLLYRTNIHECSNSLIAADLAASSAVTAVDSAVDSATSARARATRATRGGRSARPRSSSSFARGGRASVAREATCARTIRENVPTTGTPRPKRRNVRTRTRRARVSSVGGRERTVRWGVEARERVGLHRRERRGRESATRGGAGVFETAPFRRHLFANGAHVLVSTAP